MSNDLSISGKQELTELQLKTGLDEMIRPLIREIHLFDTHIEGTGRLSDVSPLTALAPGDKLTLKREVSKFDDFAVVVLNEAGAKLGYIPEKDNKIFARLMDAGKLLAARVKSVHPKIGYHEVEIGIYLVDF